MYKGSSQNRQGAVDRIRIADLERGVEVQTDEDRRRNLVAAGKSLETRIKALPKDHPDRKALGKEKCAIQEQIHALTPPKKHKPTLANHFVEAAREILSKAQFRVIWEDAHRWWREEGNAGDA